MAFVIQVFTSSFGAYSLNWLFQYEKCVLAGKTKISACPCLSISKFPSVLCTAQSAYIMQSVCLLAEVLLSTMCTFGKGTQWQLDVLFGSSRDHLGTAVSRPLALLANLLCKMGETACSSCFEQRGERHPNSTDRSSLQGYSLWPCLTSLSCSL